MSLREYKNKRDFLRTQEPRAKAASRKDKERRFVVQKHAARRLHYDLRLELGGALKSWALPKGIPLERGKRRLAIHVEDHPIDYATFEGTIPAGEYGGGTVMIWDTGTFEPATRSPAKDLAAGKLHFRLTGTKLQGEWRLVQTRNTEEWLLIRSGSDHPPITRQLDDLSTASGRTMKQIAASKTPEPSPVQDLPAYIAPMLAKQVDAPPVGNWIFELKLDGWRALGLLGTRCACLMSRNEKNLSSKFPEIVDALASLNSAGTVIDGEIVAVDKDGKPSFQLLQSRDLGDVDPPIFYYAFDILRHKGADLRRESLEHRRLLLQKVLQSAREPIRFSASLGSDANVLLERIRPLGLEGLIGKRAGSEYESNRRSGAWIKLKLHQQQEFVIGGYTDPSGSRRHLGAIMVGYYDKKRLVYAGKVGTGFNESLLKSLAAKFASLSSDGCPFENLPNKSRSRWQQGISASDMKLCHWLKPKLVCDVRFTEWTDDSLLRHPVFVGLRHDLSPGTVQRLKSF